MEDGWHALSREEADEIRRSLNEFTPEPAKHVVSGFSGLDDWLGGFLSSQLIVFGCRNPRYCNQLLLKMFWQGAVIQRKRTLLLSATESPTTLIRRAIKLEASHPHAIFQSDARVSPYEAFNQSNVEVLRLNREDSKEQLIRLETHFAKYRPEVIYYDNIQASLFEFDQETNIEILSEYSLELKCLATKFSVPLVVTTYCEGPQSDECHLHRDHADSVMFVERAVDYLEDQSRNGFRIHILKARYAKTGRLEILDD